MTEAFAHLWPLLIVIVILSIPFVMLALNAHAQKKWRKSNPATHFPDEAVERLCRVMCLADGRNPDSDGSMREYPMDGNPGQKTWMLYKMQARRYLAATKELMAMVQEHQAAQKDQASG